MADKIPTPQEELAIARALSAKYPGNKDFAANLADIEAEFAGFERPRIESGGARLPAATPGPMVPDLSTLTEQARKQHNASLARTLIPFLGSFGGPAGFLGGSIAGGMTGRAIEGQPLINTDWQKARVEQFIRAQQGQPAVLDPGAQQAKAQLGVLDPGEIAKDAFGAAAPIAGLAAARPALGALARGGGAVGRGIAKYFGGINKGEGAVLAGKTSKIAPASDETISAIGAEAAGQRLGAVPAAQTVESQLRGAAKLGAAANTAEAAVPAVEGFTVSPDSLARARAVIAQLKRQVPLAEEASASAAQEALLKEQISRAPELATANRNLMGAMRAAEAEGAGAATPISSMSQEEIYRGLANKTLRMNESGGIDVAGAAGPAVAPSPESAFTRAAEVAPYNLSQSVHAARGELVDLLARQGSGGRSLRNARDAQNEARRLLGSVPSQTDAAAMGERAASLERFAGAADNAMAARSAATSAPLAGLPRPETNANVLDTWINSLKTAPPGMLGRTARGVGAMFGYRPWHVARSVAPEGGAAVLGTTEGAMQLEAEAMSRGLPAIDPAMRAFVNRRNFPGIPATMAEEWSRSLYDR